MSLLFDHMEAPTPDWQRGTRAEDFLPFPHVLDQSLDPAQLHGSEMPEEHHYSWHEIKSSSEEEVGDE